jgi:carboxymethylenebutenolidase
MGSTIQWREPPEDRDNRSFGEMVTFGRLKDAGSGYMSQSDRVGPAVLVLHEFFGLQSSFKAIADRLNAEGFTVLAPDLYDGKLASTVDEARALAESLDIDATLRRLRAAAAFLTENWHPRLGIVGFSLGTDFAVALASEQPPEAIVLYYGTGEVEHSNWRGPTLGHFAADDEWTPLAEVEEEFAGLVETGMEAEMHVYPGTGHWFANAAVPDAYDPAAAETALVRTSEFLHHHLA